MGWLRVTGVVVPVLAFVMFWKDQVIPKKIAQWLNKVSAWHKEYVAGHRCAPGMMIYKSIAAVVFLFRPGFDRDLATLRTCSGWVEHTLYYPGEGLYELCLDCSFTKGSAWVELRDAKKQVVLRLGQKQGEGRVKLLAGSGYSLHWEFVDASGKCELRWQYQGSGDENVR